MLKTILIVIIRFYQFFISPLLGKNCRFHPTCSEYSKEAIIGYGILKGLSLSIWRVLKCQPFCSGGYDPVVHAKDRCNRPKPIKR